MPGVGGCNNANGPATVNPGGRTVGGPAPYWNTYTYDATGNRTGLVQHDITGNSLNDITTTQTFGVAKSTNSPTNAPNTGGGTGGPHALLTSTTSGPTGTKAVSYQYDAKGNTTAITDTGGTTTLAWNGEDKLDSVTKTGQAGATTYLYDADGNQLIRRNPGKTTLNLPTDELTLDTASGSTSNVRSIAAPGGLTYTRVTAAIGGGTVLIQAADPHGTSGLQVNTNATQTVTRRPTDPFGNARGTQPSANQWAGTKGFVGGTKDDTTGLTNLGARQYDTAAGRFVSPDPILLPGDPQQWNGYAYSNNNPVNLSDPTGLAPCADGIKDSCGGGGSTCQGLFCNSQPNGGKPCYYVLKNPCGTSESQGDGAAGSASDVGWGFLTGTVKFVETVENIVNPICWFVNDCKGATKKTQDFAKKNGANTNSYQFKSGKRSGEETAAGALGAVGEAGASAEEMLAASSAKSSLRRFIPCNSFDSGTLVLLADGSTEPIEDLKVGDSVLASDPATGETSTRPITATISGTGQKNLVKIAVNGSDEKSTSGLVTATDHHPFWVESKGRWVDAADLQSGDALHTDDGSHVRVESIIQWTQDDTVHNLTVAGVHTYYVLAGTTPVLVHNSNCGDLGVNWKPQNVKNPSCWSGCEDVAKQIQKKLGGGQIYRLSNVMNPPGKDNLYGIGPYMETEQGWFTHDVVVRDGRVYDGFSGRTGVPMDEFNARWGYGHDILKWTPIP
ncbi:polymorphic toxin-type HINT domain-containing protein [Kitasatospora sp. NPDC127121]|uniref:polymorphic toxin-type HINT domain-containing protein n=1 Tax=Kitasatospora sp. NPDC127121 TaxID=3345371 RepID=UPI00362BCF3B